MDCMPFSYRGHQYRRRSEISVPFLIAPQGRSQVFGFARQSGVDINVQTVLGHGSVSSSESSGRAPALLFTCFGMGMAVTEICQLRVSVYLAESKAVMTDSQMRAEILTTTVQGPLCWASKKLQIHHCASSILSEVVAV